MRNLRLAGAAVAAAISVPSLAADLGVVDAPVPSYEPTAYSQSYEWTGAYAGGHIGWAWDDADFTLNGGFWGDDGASTSIDSDGFIGGGQIGFWYQPQSNLAVGANLSGSWADLSGSVRSPEFPTEDTWATEIDWFVLAQARLGLANGRWLAFLQGGYAGADATATATTTDSPPFRVSDSAWHIGWTVGGGVSFKASRRVSFGVEYNYVDLGSKTYSIDHGSNETASVDHQIHVVKGTVNFHFNGN